MNKVTKRKKSLPIYLLFFIILIVLALFFYKTKEIPKAVFTSTNGEIKLYFSTKNYTVRRATEKAFDSETFTGQRYIIDGAPIRNYYIDYWTSTSDLSKETDYFKDTNKENPGSGCFTSTNTILINNISFQKVVCYYNPLGTTNSGKYIPGTSSILHNDCVYFSDSDVPGAIRFWGTAEMGHDTCQFIMDNFKNLRIEVNKK